jgi:hypothetical protein
VSAQEPEGYLPGVTHPLSGPLRPLLICLLGLAAACGAETPEGAPAPDPAGDPPGANIELVQALREDLAAPRHPSDGGGRAWLEGEQSAVAGHTGSWNVVYEAGPLGIEVGGLLFLGISPFWGWSTPQLVAPEDLGYTEVDTDADGVELTASTLDTHLLGIQIGGRRLEPGEKVRITYGAGSFGALTDRFAERGERIWIAVDGDGDGIRALIADPPRVDVAPGSPARLLLRLPSVARPGEPLELRVAVLDARGNAGVSVSGEVSLAPLPEGLEGPERIVLQPDDGGCTSATLTAREPGIYWISARGPGDLTAESPPLRVSASAGRILWADLHGHSNFSDGTGTPEDYLRYARDVSALDVIALTDHDHWGMRFLDAHPPLWAEIRAQTLAFNDPGRLVTLLGYEWTSWIHGHRHVLFFDDEGEVYSSIDDATDHPSELWAALRGRSALTFAHHSAGGPIPTNWAIPPDAELEPLTEIVSVHGSSEAADSPIPIYKARPGGFVRDVLDRGYRLGFVGSGDGHDGHPGLSHLGGASGGVAGILAEERTRSSVLAALRARRSYATNGPRIILDVALAGRPMGSILAPQELGPEPQLRVEVASPGPLRRLDVIRSGAIEESLELEGRRQLGVEIPLPDLRAGEYVYVRVVQEDGGTAWSSPFFVE